jgi:hypothetical protein
MNENLASTPELVSEFCGDEITQVSVLLETGHG